MSSHGSDSFAAKHESEFALLKRTRARAFFKYLGLFLLVGTAITVSLSAFLPPISLSELTSYRSELAASNSDWADNLTKTQTDLSGWLSRHGTSGEINLFNRISTFLFSSAASLARRYEENDPGFFVRTYLAGHGGILRASFMVIACWRLWLVLVAIAFYRGWSAWKVHREPDILGETGNGRLYYSGIRIGLEQRSKSGAPNQHVRGLACPPTVPESDARASELGRILSQYGASNSTNISLAATILACQEYPAYIPQASETGLLDGELAALKLPQNAPSVLEQALELHHFYQQNANAQAIETHFEHVQHEIEASNGNPVRANALELQRAFHRVLTPQMRTTLAAVPATEIASIILAYEAGKCMAYGKEGGRWVRKSAFSELTARSVIQSTRGFSGDYDFDSRSNIRRALIYGSRYSSLGPVTVPVNLAPETRAARQWVELVMACPYELERVANEVEMYAILHEVHARWMQLFIDGLITRQTAVTAGAYATSGNLFLMPISNVVRLARRAISLPMLRRLEELIELVTQDQRLRIATSGSDPDLEERSFVPVHARVFEPFSEAERNTLMQNYSMKEDEVRDWSSLRVVLNSFGWLGRRVGDHSVPESSVVFTVMRVTPSFPGANHLNLLGAPGMVPLRGTRLEERWGKSWQNHFTQVLFAMMAENNEDYQKLLSGIREEPVEDPTTAPLSSVG